MKESFFNNITLNKIILYLSYFLCFSIALPHSIFPGKAGLISLLIFILWLFEGNLKNKIQTLFASKLFLCVMGFILILSLSLLWTRYTNIGIARLSAFKYYLFLMPVLITSLTKQNSLRMIHAFVLGNILHALLMILSLYNIINLSGTLHLYNPHSVYASFFVFSSFYCFHYFLDNLNKKDIIRSIFYLSCLLLFIYLIFTNKGRSGQLSFILSTIITITLLHRSWWKTTLFIVISAAMLITISLSSKTVKLSYAAAAQDITKIIEGNYVGSWGVRWGLLITNFEIIKQNPIFGVGAGDTQDAMQRVIEQNENTNRYSLAFYDIAHNHYITVITSAGIIALTLYLLIHFYIFKLPIKQKEIKHLSLIFLVILITNSIADDILFYKPYNIYFAIMISLFINLSLDKKNITKP